MPDKLVIRKSDWSYSQGLAVCAVVGAVLGLLFAAVAILMWLTGGDENVAGQGEASLPRMILIYLGGSTLAGVIAGLLNPAGKTRVGAALLGVIAMIPLTLGTAYLLTGEVIPSDPDYAISTGATAVIIGVCAGLLMHHEFVERWT